MNLQQLEYIVAVDGYRHFLKAAQHCAVTQPTLSTMVQKLEEELGIRIFDRSRQPVAPTEEGLVIIARARKILAEVSELKQSVAATQNDIVGDIRLGIIPTLAPYLLPLFLQSLAAQQPDLRLVVREMNMEEIVSHLKSGTLDMGIIAAPAKDDLLVEHTLFSEELLAYFSKSDKVKKKTISPKEIDASRLWLLEEGHCLRSQVYNLCALNKKEKDTGHFFYEAGSIESLKQMVDQLGGVTILPRLAIASLSKKQLSRVQEFANPKPVREVSLVVHRHFARTAVLTAVQDVITAALPAGITPKQKKVVAL